MAFGVSDCWSVYIVRTKGDTLYTGVSTDVARRFQEHCSNNSRSAKALRGKGPLQLVFSQSVGDRAQAQSMECKIKKLARCDKDLLISGEINLSML